MDTARSSRRGAPAVNLTGSIIGHGYILPDGEVSGEKCSDTGTRVGVMRCW